MKSNKILAIDPSGTGTTGIFFTNGTQEQFNQFISKEWTEHYQFIFGLVKKNKPDILLYEEMNFINLRGKDMTALLRLMGALEITPVKQVEKVPVNQIKKLTKQLVSGEKVVEGVNYAKGRGKGWSFQGEKVSVHQLEAYLVYWWWKTRPSKRFDKENSRLIGQRSPKIKELWEH